MEMLKQEDRIDTVIVPIGGGGLISGVAVAAKYVNRNINVIGVQAEGASAMYESYHTKSMKKSKTIDTIAEGIAVNQPCKRTFPILRQHVDNIVSVTDEEIAGSTLYIC